MTLFIGFTGRKRSGKDTASAVFEAAGYVRLSFAEPIKAMLSIFLQHQGVDVETIERMLDGDLKEVPSSYLQGRTPRYAMQTLGTEWGRDLMGEALWTDALLNASVGCDRVVVSDVRFPNEVVALKGVGASIYRVVRPNNPAGANDNHQSEVFIDTLEVDAEFTNDAASAEEFQSELSMLFSDEAA